MPLVCRICSRANPADALYCYHDGVALNNHAGSGGPVAIGACRFHNPFVFPSGKSCRSFDELVLACESNWVEAQDLLRQGYLEGFLGSLGRADLARAARQAAQTPDHERALDEFLSKLPSDTRTPPQLEVRPLEINLGELSRDKDQRVTLELANLGMGLVSGSISTNCDWITLGEGTGSPRKLVQFRTESSIPVRIIGKCLRAGAKQLEGRLSIETSGGGATVVVRAEVPVKPFPSGVLGGAKTPRELASKAKHNIKDAAPCFERGEIENWYRDNGWTYPVQGPNFSGIHAIQQFFEALGLVKPPPVQISTRSLYLAGAPGNGLTEEIKVQAEEKKPVFAYGISSAPWLRVGKTVLEGRTARIPVSVPAVPAMPGERLQARVEVTANGNQRFTVEVTLNIAGTPNPRSRAPEPVLELAAAAAIPGLPAPLVEVPYGDVGRGQPPPRQGGNFPPPLPLMPSLADVYDPSAPVATVVPLPDIVEPEPVLEVVPLPNPPRRREEPVDAVVLDPIEEPPPRRRFWIHLLPSGILLLLLLGTLVRDLVVKASGKPESVAWSGEALDPHPRILLGFHDRELEVRLGKSGIKPQGGVVPETTRPAYWEPSMRFGLQMLDQQDPARPGKLKRLTFEELGMTNNAVVRLDGQEWIFGDRPFREANGQYAGAWPGEWLERDQHLPKTEYSVDGHRSTWVYKTPKIEVTQTVEIVRGSQSGLLDTCLVRYQLHNRDNQPHNVGIRFLLDTFIGGNDGVPFLIPGATALCSDSRDFDRPERIPPFIQALEHEDLANPGTIAQVGFRVGGGLEVPTRVTLGAWPNPALQRFDGRCMQEKTLWEVPLLKIHQGGLSDSAVTIYWDEKGLAPGSTRSVGFSYGLGNVSADKGGGKLALTTGGSFAPRGEFTVTAYVSNPVSGQTVTLTVPEDFDLLDSGKQAVPELPPGATSRNSPVTWKVRGPSKEGAYTIKADSSTGVSQTQTVKIRSRGLFGE